MGADDRRRVGESREARADRRVRRRQSSRTGRRAFADWALVLDSIRDIRLATKALMGFADEPFAIDDEVVKRLAARRIMQPL